MTLLVFFSVDNNKELLTFRQPERHYQSHLTITKSFDSDDDLHSGFRNISHRQQSFSGLHSPERSDNTIT